MQVDNPMTETVVSFADAFIMHRDKEVLSDVNFTISSKEFLYLVGKTGSGKSSLLKSIYGAIPFTKGHGSVAGYDLTKLDRHNIPLLRRKLGMVFQEFNLLTDRNVFKNLDFVLRATGWKDKNERKNRISEVLERTGMVGKEDSMPLQLSGGEQQRIAICRAMLNKPKLLIADEPTGNLDPQTSEDIMFLFNSLPQESDTAVLIATHNYHLIDAFPGRVIRCEDGKVSELVT